MSPVRYARAALPGLLLMMFVCAPALLYAFSLTGPRQEAFLKEGGPLENLTVMFYAILILTLLALSRSRHGRGFFISSAWAAALLAGRELDLDSAFSTHSIFSIRTYGSAKVLLGEKLVAGAAVLILLAFSTWYVRQYSPRFWRGLKSGHPFAMSALIGIALMAGSALLDTFARTVRRLTGVVIHTGLWLQTLEETFELAIPLMLLWAVGQAYPGVHSNKV